MCGKVLGFLGVSVIATALSWYMVKCQCTTNHCFNDDSEMDIRKMLSHVEYSLDSMKSEAGSMKEEIGSLKEEMGSLNEEISSMKREFGSLKKELSSLKDNLSSTNTAKDQLPTCITNTTTSAICKYCNILSNEHL